MTVEKNKSQNIHVGCGVAVDMVLKSALVRRTLDNVTCVIIGFDNFENSFEDKALPTQKNLLENGNTIKNSLDSLKKQTLIKNSLNQIKGKNLIIESNNSKYLSEDKRVSEYSSNLKKTNITNRVFNEGYYPSSTKHSKLREFNFNLK
jgi:hypothetical protein